MRWVEPQQLSSYSLVHWQLQQELQEFQRNPNQKDWCRDLFSRLIPSHSQNTHILWSQICGLSSTTTILLGGLQHTVDIFSGLVSAKPRKKWESRISRDLFGFNGDIINGSVFISRAELEPANSHLVSDVPPPIRSLHFWQNQENLYLHLPPIK